MVGVVVVVEGIVVFFDVFFWCMVWCVVGFGIELYVLGF